MEKHLIKQILLEQKGEVADLFKERIVERECGQSTKKMFGADLVKVIMGVRRCGKSVLAHQSLRSQEYGYINFDDERLIGATKEDLNNFLEVLQEIHPGFKYLLLDEAQNIEGWELFVNRLKRRRYIITVTGSNAKLLSKELATHLTGRHFTIELYPFSFKEFLSYRDISIDEKDFYATEKRALINRSLDEYLTMGGFPEVLHLEAWSQYLRELFDKIITRDVVLRYNIKYVKALKEAALYVISNFGARLTYNKLKNIFEMKSVHTVKNYLNYLEETYLVFQLEPFSFKIKEQVKQPRKVYCIDTGLISALIPKTTIDHGRIMENAVFLELKRRGKEVFYYSDPSFEVDFLVKEGKKIAQLIQVCRSLNDGETKKREIKALLRVGRSLQCRRLLVVTSDQEGEEKAGGEKIQILPLWKWLLEK